jgi:hypothetical protein
MRIAIICALSATVMGTPVAAQIDFSGEWRALMHEDIAHRLDEASGAPGISGAGGPHIGDYTGLPINDDARFRADTWDVRINNAREHQAILQPGQYWIFANGGLRITKRVEERTQRVIAFSIFRAANGGSTTRTIWMDGRPHPPEYAAHSWWGFSTGRWAGDVLVVTTTHLKASWIRRNGVPASDRATVTEYFTRRGNYLTVTRFVDDPMFLDEPYVASVSWMLNPRQLLVPSPENVITDEVPGQPRAFVPHFLPGANTALREFADTFDLPFEATRGGRETAYPEYRRTLEALAAARSKRGTR